MTLVSQAIKLVIAVASVIVLSRLILPADFGLVAMVTAITGVAAVFLDFGLSVSALRQKDLNHQQQSNLFWLNTAAGILLTGIMFALSWPVAVFFGEPDLVIVMQWVSFTYLLGGLSTQFRVVLNRALRFVTLAVCEVLAPVLGLAIAILLAMFGFSIAALIAQQLVTALVLLAVPAFAARWWPSWPRRTEGMRELVSFGVGFAATQLLSYATRNVDSIALGRVTGAEMLGQYNRAYQLAVAPLAQINAPMTKVALPALARVIDDPPRYASALREAQLIACYLTATAVLVFGGVAMPLTDVLLGPEWSSAGQLLGVLAVGSVFRAIQQISNWIFVSHGKAASLLRCNLVGQPIIIAFLIAGLPWGAMGVAVGGGLGYMAYWVLSLVWAGHATGTDVAPLFAKATRAVGMVGLPAGLGALAVSLFVPLDSVWRVVLGLVVALLWLAVVTLVSTEVRHDLKRLIQFARLAVGRRS